MTRKSGVAGVTHIINLTQHAASPEQIAAGVRDIEPELKEQLTRLLTFDSLPDQAEIERRARSLAYLAVWCYLCEVTGGYCGNNCRHSHRVGAGAMIGGAPYLMAALERALKKEGVTPLYAFSVRESAEQEQPDGSVRKVATFRHAGFVPA